MVFRNSYDSDNTVFSPQGRLHQVEYALEAVRQGSAAVGLRSKTHAILLTLKRSTGELASYQQKAFKIDDHLGIAIAGLTSDARVLSNYMRNQAMSSRLLYGRPIPVGRIVSQIAEKAQLATQQYGRRPYGVGFLVIGQDVGLYKIIYLNIFTNQQPRKLVLISMSSALTVTHSNTSQCP